MLNSLISAEVGQPQDFLPICPEPFNTVEIDNTFYRIPAAKMVDGWGDRTPSGFVFAAKVPRIITHDKVLTVTKDDLNRLS